jgi:sterol 24-C-methyltransferase
MVARSSASDDASEPLINDNPALQSYYESLESRIGYRLILGGTRHFGYYDKDTRWPFPIGRSLRRMERKLLETLALPAGSRVLDAGCGVGHVAIYMAKHGLNVTGIDVVDRHIARASRNIKRAGLESRVAVQKMDYHHLDAIEDASKEGIYTMETFVHATDPAAVLAGFFRILRPGGRIALFEYDHDFDDESTPRDLAHSMRQVNNYAAMPTNDKSARGYFRKLLEEAGFQDVVVHDLTENVKPMLRLFFYIAIVPYYIISLLGLEKYFVNTVAGARGYIGIKYWRYIAVSATKPGPALESAKTR